MANTTERLNEIINNVIIELENKAFVITSAAGAPNQVKYKTVKSTIDVELPETAGVTSAYEFENQVIEEDYRKSGPQIYLETIINEVLMSVSADYISRRELISDGTDTLFSEQGSTLIGFTSSRYPDDVTNVFDALQYAVLSGGSGGMGTEIHNELNGIQGGTEDEYYHLTSSQHSNLTSATPSFSSIVLSNLTNNRLVQSDGSNNLISTIISDWISGTTNEIDVTDDLDGTVTLSISSSFNLNHNNLTSLQGGTTNEYYHLTSSQHSNLTSTSPSFTGLTLSGLTNNRLVQSNGSNNITSVTNLANYISGTTNEIVITDDSDGTITISIDPAFSGGGGTNHNLLSGLQGGTSGEYYHLTSAQHSNLTATSPSFIGLTLTGIGNTRIPFSVSGVLTGDAALTWDNNNNILNIGTTSDTSTDLKITSSTTGFSNLTFADSDSNIGRIYYNHTNNTMIFRTNDTEHLELDSSGNFKVNNLTSGRIPLTGANGFFDDAALTWDNSNKTLDLLRNVNGGYHGLSIENPNTGTTANSFISVGESFATGNNGLLQYINSGFATSGFNIAESFQIQARSNATGGLVLTTRASAPIKFYTADSQRGLWDSSGNFKVNNLTTDRIPLTGANGFFDDAALIWDNTNKRINLTRDTTSWVALRVMNQTAASNTSIYIGEDSNNAIYMQHFGSGFTSSGLAIADSGRVITNTQLSGGMTVGTLGSSPLRLGTNNTTRAIIPSTGNFGIGTNITNASYPLDIQVSTGNTTVRAGTNQPIYLIQNNPHIGFNSYFNSGWKFGAGSAGDYGAAIGLNPGTGLLSIYISDSTGNTDDDLTLDSFITLDGSTDEINLLKDVNFGGEIISNMLPSVNTLNLGSSGNRWGTLFTQNINISSRITGGNLTPNTATQDLGEDATNRRWRNFYAESGSIKNTGGTQTTFNIDNDSELGYAQLTFDVASISDFIIRKYGSGAAGTTLGLSNNDLTLIQCENVLALSSVDQNISLHARNIILNASSDEIVMSTNGSDRMRVENNGFVGIGTTPSNSILHLYRNATIGGFSGGFTVNNAGLRIQDSSQNMYFDGNGIVSDGSFQFGTNASAGITIGTNSTERMIFDGSSYVIDTRLCTLRPDADGNGSLGESGTEYGSLFVNGLVVDGGLIESNLISDSSSGYDIGSSSDPWERFYIDDIYQDGNLYNGTDSLTLSSSQNRTPSTNVLAVNPTTGSLTLTLNAPSPAVPAGDSFIYSVVNTSSTNSFTLSYSGNTRSIPTDGYSSFIYYNGSWYEEW